MNALIIEDEKAALRNLKAIIAETGYEIAVVGETDSIWDTVEWLKNHSMPDLVFMDIHLADGSAFEIFHHVDITSVRDNRVFLRYKCSVKTPPPHTIRSG